MTKIGGEILVNISNILLFEYLFNKKNYTNENINSRLVWR